MHPQTEGCFICTEQLSNAALTRLPVTPLSGLSWYYTPPGVSGSGCQHATPYLRVPRMLTPARWLMGITKNEKKRTCENIFVLWLVGTVLCVPNHDHWMSPHTACKKWGIITRSSVLFYGIFCFKLSILTKKYWNKYLSDYMNASRTTKFPLLSITIDSLRAWHNLNTFTHKQARTHTHTNAYCRSSHNIHWGASKSLIAVSNRLHQSCVC